MSKCLDLNESQSKFFEFIKEFHQENGISPSLRDLAGEFNITPEAVRKRLWTLEKRQYIYVHDGVPRGIAILKNG